LEKKSSLKRAESSDFSVINDSEDQDEFTKQIPHLKGAPAASDLLDHLDAMDLDISNLQNYQGPVNSMQATKTGFQAVKKFKNFEFQRENLIESIFESKKVDPSTLRARTKGRFMDHVAQDPATNYFRDMAWLKKANPNCDTGLRERNSD
jgi:hypothetical protein